MSNITKEPKFTKEQVIEILTTFTYDFQGNQRNITILFFMNGFTYKIHDDNDSSNDSLKIFNYKKDNENPILILNCCWDDFKFTNFIEENWDKYNLGGENEK